MLSVTLAFGGQFGERLENYQFALDDGIVVVVVAAGVVAVLVGCIHCVVA